MVDTEVQLLRIGEGKLVLHGPASHSENSPVVASRHVD